MKHFTTTAARKNLSSIVNQVKYQKLIIAIGRRNVAEVFVVPAHQIQEDLPISNINAESSSFAFLEDEADLYSLNDLKKRYV